MRRILLIGLVLMIAATLEAQQPCGPWRFLVGVQMPPSSGPASKVTLYFKPMPPVTPVCEVTFAVREAAIVDVQQSWVTVAGKPETRIDIGCTLPEGKPQ